MHDILYGFFLARVLMYCFHNPNVLAIKNRGVSGSIKAPDPGVSIGAPKRRERKGKERERKRKKRER